MQLCDVLLNKKYYIKKLSATGTLRGRLQDLGLVEGTEITGVFRAPLGEPTAYLVRGTLLALRDEDAGKIEVESVSENE